MSLDPLILTSFLADEVSEAGYIGAFSGASIPVIKCETNNLFVPFTSKIVFEGSFPLPKQPQKFHWEENARLHLPCDTHNWPVYKANCITHRDDAILPMSACRRLTDETVSSLMIPYVNGLIG